MYVPFIPIDGPDSPISERIIQSSLRTAGLLLTPGGTASYPRVPQEVLDNYLKNGTHGPTHPVLLDWTVGLSTHAWNKEAVSIISQRCLEDVQKEDTVVGKLSELKFTLSHNLVQRCVKTKLSKALRETKHRLEHGEEALEQRLHASRIQDRRTTRRNTVRSAFYLTTHVFH